MNDEKYLLPSTPAPEPLVEICRSFSYKYFAKQYESRDFFCSQKAECHAGDAERVSKALYEFCYRAVMDSVREYDAECKRRTAQLEHFQEKRRA